MVEQLSVKYSVTLEDIVKWHQYHFSKSPGARRARAIWVWGLSALVLLVSAAATYLTGDWVRFSAGLAYAIIYPAYSVLGFNRRVRRITQNAYSQGRNRGTLGEHTMQIADDGIVATSEVGEGKTRWAGVERVVEIDGYAFIYVGAALAFVIPEHRVTEGDYRVFVDELKRRLLQPADEAGSTTAAGSQTTP